MSGLFYVYEVNIRNLSFVVNKNNKKTYIILSNLIFYDLIDKRKPAEAGWVNGFSFKLTLYLQNICLPHEPI